MASEEIVVEAISSFSCEKDPDIVSFLNDRAIEFEKQSKSRTYLLVEEEQLAAGNFVLLAYFTIALQVLKLSGLGLSNRKIKEYDGFSAKRNGEIISEFPVFLIGQLAKNDTYKEFNGKLIMDYALSAIKRAQEIVGGRIVLVECHNIFKLIKFYQVDNGFTVIRQDADRYVQLIKIV